MRRELLDLLRCPVCRGRLRLREDEAQGLDVVEGALTCARCRAEYRIHRRLPSLLPKSATGTYAKEREASGWVSLWRKAGMYDHPDEEGPLLAPNLGGKWDEVARHFDLALRELELKGGETVLDLGAGVGWAARHFAQRGCRVVAVDVVPDELYGLGRAWSLMERYGVHFEPLLGDGETLPFRTGAFDVVFMCGALHHFETPGPVLREVRRVLKSGGRFVAAGEPAISVRFRERDVVAAMEEVQEGITERRPKAYQYWWALRRAGFHQVQVDLPETYRARPPDLYRWIAAVRDLTCRGMNPRYRALAWLAYSLALAIPPRPAAWLMFGLQGGTFILRATK